MDADQPDHERLDALFAADDLDGLNALLAEDPSFARVRGPRGESMVLRALYHGRGRLAQRLAQVKEGVDTVSRGFLELMVLTWINMLFSYIWFS